MTPRPRNHSHERLYQLALEGNIPAEQLPQYLRWRLVAELHDAGWTDQEIAAHTRQTTYTTARIRGDLELPPNRESGACGYEIGVA